MGYKDNIVPGWVPQSGAIFTSNIGTKKECFRQKLFGLPSAMSHFVLHVKRGMILFLFEFERRQLYGVFRATCDGDINIVPTAFKSSGRQFPAQVRFTSVWNCHPLDESEFRDAIRDNYFSGRKFNFGLSEDQVYKLMTLFHTKRIPKNHPERNIWKYGDKQAEEDGRFDDRRRNRDGRFDDHRMDRDGRFNDHRTDRGGRFDRRIDRGGRFDDHRTHSDDHRTHLFRDRLGFISKEDSPGLDICEYVGEEDRVDDHVYRNADYVEQVKNINCNRGQRNRSVTVERLQEGNRDRFLTNYIALSNDVSDHGARQAISGNHLDHSLGGLRRVSDAGLHDVRDVHDNLGEIRGIGNEDRFLIDANRIQDEHRVINDFWQTMNDGRCFGYESEQATPDKQEGTNDVWIKPNYDEGSTSRPSTYTEYDAGIKPRYYKDYGFGDVSPTNDSIRGVVSTNYIGFSHGKQNTLNSDANPISEAQDLSLSEKFRHLSEFGNIGKTYDCGLPYSTSDARMITMPPILYDSEASDIRLRPSSLAAGPSSSLIDDCSLYPSSKRASLSMSQVETAENVIKGHRSGSMSLSSGYDNSHLGEPRSEYIRRVSESSCASEKLFASDAGLSPREDDPIRHGKIFRLPRDDKQHDGSDYDKRISVFSRLRSAREAVGHEQGFDDSRERHENWESSVNNVMEMLEDVVGGSIKRTGTGFKQHDDIVAGRIIDYELSKVKVELDADSADETIEGGSGSILHETRLVDFRRRKKANRNVNEKSKEKNLGLIEFEKPAGNIISELDVGSVETNPLIGMPCKRRRLVRPVFVRNENKNKNEPAVDAKSPPPVSDEITPLKGDSDPTKAVESSEEVEASVESIQVSGGCQKDAIEGEASLEIGGDGNAGNDQALDGNEREGSQEKRDVEGVSGVGSPKDDGKMCGWIEC